MKCPNCRRETSPDGRFCIFCGAALPAPGPGHPSAREQGQDRLSQLTAELSHLEFFLQEVRRVAHRGVVDASSREKVEKDVRSRQVELLLEVARLHRRQGASSRALEVYRQILALEPSAAEAHYESGVVYQARGNMEAAIRAYLEATEARPGWAAPRFSLGALYERQGRYGEAVREFRDAAALEEHVGRRQEALGRAHRLEARLAREALARPLPRPQPLSPTVAHLDYLLTQLDLLYQRGLLSSDVFSALREEYTLRREALVAPPPPALAPPPTERAPPPASIRVEAPPPAAPPKPAREPFDWRAFWAALFSERTLTAVLGFGVLLVAVSSLALLVSLWRAHGWESIWLQAQGILAGQLLMFLVAGYVVKERIRLHLSGLAIITIAALWIPLNLGALMFKLFTNQINEARAAADGYYLAVPGIGVPLDLPTYGWLIIAATCVATWGALTFRFRGHLLTHGTVVSVGATVALFLAVLGVVWEWQVAALAVLTIPLLLTWQHLRQTSFRVVAEPLFWTAQATLWGVAVVLLVAFILGGASGYSVALVALAGAGLYATAHRFSPKLAYEYLFASLPVTALLFALAEAEILPLRYYDALLIGISVIYIIIGRAREKRYDSELLRSSRWPELQPVYAVGYLCVAVAILWPSFAPVSRLGVLYGATALTLLSAGWFGKGFWTYLASLVLVAAVLLTLNQIGQPPLDYWSVALGFLAWVYLAGGVALRRAPAHALPLFIGAFALSLASLAWAVYATDLAVLGLALPVAITTYVASAVSIHRGMHMALVQMLGYAARLRRAILRDEATVKRRSSVLFTLMAAALAPVWTTVARLWADMPELWAGLDFVALAFAYTFVAYRLTRRELGSHARVVLALGTLLALAAPTYHAASVGSSWVLVGILYAEVAVAALAATLLRSQVPRYLAAMLLLAPFGLTLDLVGLSPLLWSTPLMAVAVAYLGLGLLLSRAQTTSARPFYHVGYGASLVALAWTVAWVLTNWWDPIPDTASIVERLFMSIGLSLAAVAYSITAYRRRETGFGHLAAWVVVGALGILLDGTPLTLGGAAIAVALGAVAYVLAGVVLKGSRQLLPAGGTQGRPQALSRRARLGSVFSQPLLVAGYGVALVSVGMATIELLQGREATWPVNLVYMINVALLGASAYLLHAPAFAHRAATLFLLPFSLFAYNLFGETSGLLGLPSAALAFGWTGLAVGYLALGMAVEQRAPRYSQALPALGCLLLLAAAVASLGSAVRQSVVFGAIVAIAGASAFLTHRRVTSNFVELVSKLRMSPPDLTRKYVTLAFVAAASLLSPLWGLEILALFTREAPVQGLVLALAAPAYLLTGMIVGRRTVSVYAAPIYVAGCGMSVVATLLTITSQPLNITALAVGSATYALSAHVFRRSAWSPLPLYLSLGMAVASYSRVLAMLPLEAKYVGLALLPGVVVSLGVAWLLRRRADRLAALPPGSLVERYISAESALAWQVPFLVVGHGLTLAAVALSVPHGLLRLFALLAATGIYAASLGVFRTWGWLYPLLASANLAFASLLTLLGLGLPVIGILFLIPTLAMGFFMRMATRGSQTGDLRALMMPWAIPFIVFGILGMGTSVVLAASADWAGLTVSASYAVLAAVAAHATGNRILPYASTAFVTASVIFTSRMFELGWSQSAVVWAVQGLLMWWGGQAFGALSRRGRPEADTQIRLGIWQAPLRNAGLRLSWFALAFVVALFFLGLIAPDRFGAAQVQDATAVLAFLGLLYLGMAFVARRVRFGYLAIALLLASWTLQLVDREIPYAQAYAIPTGLYLLGIAFFERRRAAGTLPAFIEGAAVLLLVVSSFWQSVVDDPGWAYAMLLAVEAVLLVVWGAANNTKLLFVGGILAFVVNALYQTTDLLATLPGAWIGVTVGLFLVTAIAVIEWRREQLIRLGREWAERLSQWGW